MSHPAARVLDSASRTSANWKANVYLFQTINCLQADVVLRILGGRLSTGPTAESRHPLIFHGFLESDTFA
jgi:hypothetical protein